MVDPNADLLGNTDWAAQAGAVGADAASRDPNEEEDDRVEQELVSKLMKEYTAARDFDKEARVQYIRDRKYAGGVADTNWASDANLTGSFIDILVSFLYAQNPDAGVRAARQIEAQPNPNSAKFAETLELVIDRLWRDGNLKRMGKKWVRSALTVGAGWIKATMLTQKVPSPQLDKRLNTLQDQMRSIGAAQHAISEGDNTADDIEVQKAALQLEIDGIQAQLLKKKRFGFMGDFVLAENVQVALNISDLADYTDADWISTDIYVVKDTLKERFPDLDDDDIKSTTTYYQRNAPKSGESTDSQSAESGEGAGEGQFSKSAPNGAFTPGGGQGKLLEFAKIIELWDRRDYMVKTMIDGLKEWAEDPYPPPQASTRFYPFFYLAFFPVDGQRHGQSLPWRLHKLQDEFASCRSNQRLTRERSVTGVIFNAAAVDPDDAKKIADANQQELIGVRTVADQPLSNIFIAKPVGSYNPELYNTAPIRSDMEAISGVQEALQQNASASAVQPKTATEAQIQQQGFTSRTGSDRDVLETALTDLSQYTAEVATQECTLQWVQKVCGPNAFWLGPDPIGAPMVPPGPPDPQTGMPTSPGSPAKPPSPGMDVEDVLTMVEVDIDAGTTGRPNLAADKANWATLLPLLEKSLMQIRQMQLTDPGLAKSLLRVLEETLHRMDDRLDIDEFIPQGTPSPPLPEAPKMTVTIQLKGAITPEQEAMLLGAEAELHHLPIPGANGAAGPPGITAPPGAPNMAAGAAPGLQHGLPIPSHIPGTAMPMPPLSLEKHTAPKPAAPPSK